MPIPGWLAMAKGLEHCDQLRRSHRPTPGIMDKVGLEWPHKGNVGAAIRKSEDKHCESIRCALT